MAATTYLLGMHTLPQSSFFLTAHSVRKSYENRQGRVSVSVTVRDNPSGKNRRGKSSFPDGNPSRNSPWRLRPSGKMSTVGFYSAVREEFPWRPRNVRDSFNFPRRPTNCQRNFKLSLSVHYRQGLFKLSLSVHQLSGMKMAFPSVVQPSGLGSFHQGRYFQSFGWQEQLII
jgi:hypothetical protein